MTELIKITENNGEIAVSGRELHSFLGMNTQFTIWIKRMIEYGFTENEDYGMVIQKRLTNNPKNPCTEETDYVLTLDMAKEIAMIQKSDKGKQARLYFIECEKKVVKPMYSVKELLTMQLESILKLEAAEKDLGIANNKLSLLSHTNKLYNTTEIAKELGFKSANVLNKKLFENKIQYNSGDTWVLYSQYAESGFVVIKQEILETGVVIYHRKWTQAGREFILKLKLN